VNLLLRRSSALITLQDKGRILDEVKTNIPPPAQHTRDIILSTKRHYYVLRVNMQTARDVNTNKTYHARPFFVAVPNIISIKSDTQLLRLTFQRIIEICFIYGISPYRAVNTFHHGYKSALYEQSARNAL
jgi:hypothetical protein